METVGTQSFDAKIASRSYHVYKETSWSKNQDGEEVKVELETRQSCKNIDSCACAIPATEEYFKRWKTVVHISRDTYLYTYITSSKQRVVLPMGP